MPKPSNPPSVPPPQPSGLRTSNADEHSALYQAVYNALFALPSSFQTELTISGVLATDLFTFNSSLGATIEAQVVAALNEMRSVWDADQKYALYSFVRQSQRFPDVILRASAPEVEPSILMGIELKGWYVLAKEREPSFRYRVTPNVCAPQDLLVVYPWALNNVISGSPKLFEPYVTEARYAAEYRNWHWQHQKASTGSNAVALSSVSHYYPTKAELIADVPASDNGGNFGRFARTGLMDSYMAQVFGEKLSGIPLYSWQKFLAIFSEERSEEDILRSLERMAEEANQSQSALDATAREAVASRLREIAELIQPA